MYGYARVEGLGPKLASVSYTRTQGTILADSKGPIYALHYYVV